ncbi:MAG: glycerate kinase [Betaproteobacteria bacterium AqS2]|uniref:Glycerate kinase n=1 Tax=Candidatus Amphirhobacter heronislandensis TaxID=1732024 RepID=A0A930UF60_9GAMM|nr:glycerate kinase [Betaproteobacteria bacterium AqS2]
MQAEERLRALYAAAVDAARPAGRIEVPAALAPKGRLIVLGAGKAAGSMAAAFEEACEQPIAAGLVVTSYGNAAPTRAIEVVEASHPVPDANGLRAAERIMALAKEAGPDDAVVFLGSGGGSALLALPAPGLELADKQAITKALLASGAPITEINNVRKSLSAVKGGRLAQAAAPARVLSYLISDMPGDDAALIASGPTLASPQGFEPLAVLEKHGVEVDERVREAIAANPAPAALAGAEYKVIAKAADSLAAAAALADSWGWEARILGDAIEGEARAVARTMAAEARALQSGLARPVALLSGGETTVEVRGEGKGGRNQEFCLALALALDGQAGIHAIAADTDGIDGATVHAGAVVAPDSLARMQEQGVDPQACLEANDAQRAFEAAGGLVTTGPSLTNVNDFRAVLVEPAAA